MYIRMLGAIRIWGQNELAVHRIHYLTKCSFIRISEQSQPWENSRWKFDENSEEKSRKNNENRAEKWHGKYPMQKFNA